MIPRTHNTRIKSGIEIPTPRMLREKITASAAAIDFVERTRGQIWDILSGKNSNKFLVIIGPCSERSRVHGYRVRNWIRKLQDDCPHFLVLKRTCISKPRTIVGWRGVAVQPRIETPDEMKIFDRPNGLILSRQIFVEHAEMLVPTSLEVFGHFDIHCLSDVVCHGWIGARTVGDPTHRYLASGLSMPVGFKNGVDGSVQTAIDAVITASHPTEIDGPDDDGMYVSIPTFGNPQTHIILRGGVDRPNYDGDSLYQTKQLLIKTGLINTAIVVDCNHSNSGKNPLRQIDVAKSVMWDKLRDSDELGNVRGLMIESDEVGKSLTDQCLDLDTSYQLVVDLHKRFADSLTAVSA